VILVLATAFVFLAGPTVRPEGAVLRAACATDAGEVARLSGGTPLRVRFAFSGEIGTCYKVDANGTAGYLMAAEIAGLEDYQRGLHTASDRELPQMIRAEVTRLREASTGRAGETGVLELLETSRPREALRLMETTMLPALRVAGRKPQVTDAYLLALAGLAAFQSDEAKRAAGYWAESLAIHPDPAVERLYRKVQGELKSDTSRQKVASSRFDLRYDRADLNESTASQLVNVLNSEYDRLNAALGCGADEKITAIVQTLDAYRAATGAEEWSGGQFDGRIRVVLQDGQVTSRTRKALAHELVHACLARNGRFERWFHEGMAQRWSEERPNSDLMREAARRDQMPDWRKSTEEAHVFYAWSLLAVERLYSIHGDYGVRQMLRNPSSVKAR
jgi:hypothetical protein